MDRDEGETSRLFVCYGSQSLDAAQRIALALRPAEQERCHFLVTFDGRSARRMERGHFRFMNPPAERYSDWRRPFAIATWFVASMKEWEPSLSEFVLYLPHLFELPGNVLLFDDKRVSRVELLPDGLINYYQHEVKPEGALNAVRYAALLVLRMLAARRAGFRYAPQFSGHITGYEKGYYRRTWTDQAKGLVTVSGEVALLPVRADDPAPPEGDRTAPHADATTLLILDQELDAIAGPHLEDRMRRALIKKAQELAPTRVLYKAHPRGVMRLSSLEAAGLAASDESKSGPAEQLLRQRTVTSILGYFSSPLLQNQDEVPARFAILPHPSEKGVRRPRRVAALREALTSANVSVLSPEEVLGD